MHQAVSLFFQADIRRRCVPGPGQVATDLAEVIRRRFTGALRKFVIYRDGTSRRPCSDAPIYDIDHIDRHAVGGPTKASNAEGAAVFDHHLLDLSGWTVDGDGNHTITWTTPTGHRYVSRPPPILGWGNNTKPHRRRQQRRRCRRWPPVVDIHYPDHHRRRHLDE